MAELKSVQGGEDIDSIKNALKKVEEASHKLSEAMYKAAAETAQANGAGGAGPQAGQPGDAGAGAKAKAKGKDDSAVDADFEVVE